MSQQTAPAPGAQHPPQAENHETENLKIGAGAPPETLRLLKQTFASDHIEKGIQWVLERTNEDHSPLNLAEDFTKRFEEQMVRLCGNKLEDHILLFRAALFQKCLRVLPYFRIRFSDKGYNPLFLHTWFQKQLLAALLGITLRDVEMKIRHSGRTAPRYLDDQLAKLLPKTPLKSL